MASRTRQDINDINTSLLDLGYNHAGIDDGWQKCNSGPNGKGFHNSSGFPIVNTDLFPDMKAMASVAISLGLVPGWYANNCHCSDHFCSSLACYKGDVSATTVFGFGSVKMDRAGPIKNATLLAQLYNQTGRHILIENNNAKSRRVDGHVQCPMHMFRTSGDARPTFGSVLSNLLSVNKYNVQGLTGPGCWVCAKHSSSCLYVTVYLIFWTTAKISELLLICKIQTTIKPRAGASRHALGWRHGPSATWCKKSLQKARSTVLNESDRNANKLRLVGGDVRSSHSGHGPARHRDAGRGVASGLQPGGHRRQPAVGG